MVGAKSKDNKLPKCGIVMPISECDGCSETHWKEVQTLIQRSAQKAGFEATLVSDADDAGVIQKRIVQNLYECPVVVCDISGRNANVMFELGMRLAFDKPTVVVKDDRTPFSFDTSPIEHVTYPRDLRFSKMEAFQEKLTEKLKETSASDGKDSFLKSFGSFKVADISVEKTSVDALLLEEISSLKTEVRQIRHFAMDNSSFDRRAIHSKRYTKFHIDDGVTSGSSVRFPIERDVVNERGFLDTLETLEGLPGVLGVKTEINLVENNAFVNINLDDAFPKIGSITEHLEQTMREFRPRR